MTKTLKLFFGLLVGGMVGVCAAPKILPAQQPWQFPRTTGITAAMDTSVVVVSDSLHSTKGMTAAQLRKLLGARAFDSLMTANIFRAAGLASLNGSVSIGAGTHFQWAASDTVLGTTFLKDTVKGQPVWLGIPQHLLADSATLADSAIGANRAQILTTARTIGGVSFNGSANTTVATATGGFTITGGTLAHARDSMSVNTALIFAGTDTIFGQPAWNATQAFATGQRVDSATGAARSQILTTARTIGGVSFNGSANTTVATATGGFTVTGGTLATGRDSISANTALVFAGTDTVIGQPAWATNLQHLTADTATLAKNLTGSPAITVSSCSGCSSFPLLAPNGSATAPDYSYTNSTGLGHYRFGADTLGIAAAGRLAATVVDSALRVQYGRASKPSFGFIGTGDTLGMYRFGVDTLGFATAGVTRAILLASGSGAYFKASGAGNLIIGSGTGNNRVVGIQVTDGSGNLNTVLQIGNGGGGISTGNSTTINSTSGTVSNPSFAVQSGGAGGLGIYSSSLDTMAFASSGALSLAISGGAAAKLTGGAGNFNLQCGTGNSRTCTFQSTTSAGTAKNTLVLGADSSVTALGQIIGGTGTSSLPTFSFSAQTGLGLYRSSGGVMDFVNGGTLYGRINSQGFGAIDGSSTTPSFFLNSNSNTGFYRQNNVDLGVTVNGTHSFTFGATADTLYVPLVGVAGNMTILAGTGNSRTMTLQSSNSSGTATTYATGSGDTLKFGGHAIATGFTTAAGTPGTVCYNTATFELSLDNATTCVVSARRFKHDIAPLSLADAARIVMGLKPSTFTYNVGGRKAIGLVAEEADSTDSRLGFRNADSSLNSVDYLAIGPVLVRLVQEQQTEISSLSKQLAAVQAQQPAIDSLRIAVALLTKKPASKASAVPTPKKSLDVRASTFSGPTVSYGRFAFDTTPPSIMFSPAGKTVLTITPDGRFILGPGATVDDAAKAIVDVANKSRASAIPRSGVDTLHQRMHQ